MTTTPRPACVCCAQEADGEFTLNDRPESTIPVCEQCYRSGAFEHWLKESFELLRTSSVAFESTGNIAKDRKKLEDYLRHSERIKDGVCPNGCARMIRHAPGDDHIGECPVCHFIMQSNVPLQFIE